MGFQALFKFVKCWRAPDVVRETHILPVTITWHLVADRHSSYDSCPLSPSCHASSRTGVQSQGIG